MVLDEIWPTFVDSFPYNERRTFKGQKELFYNKLYNCKVYKEEGNVKAFVCYWNFDDFVFVEHLAVNSNFRGGGIGSEIIEDMKELNVPVILEVEPIDENDINTKRRVAFYKKNGFKFNNYFYEQPPLNEESDYLELKIMSYPENLNNKEFEEMKATLLDFVY